MKKKSIYFIGVTVLFVVLIGFNSCEKEEYDFEYPISNNSSYTIVIEIDKEFEIIPKRAEIRSGGKQIFKTNRFYPDGFTFKWHLKDGGFPWQVRWDSDSGSFVNSSLW